MISWRPKAGYVKAARSLERLFCTSKQGVWGSWLGVARKTCGWLGVLWLWGPRLEPEWGEIGDCSWRAGLLMLVYSCCFAFQRRSRRAAEALEVNVYPSPFQSPGSLSVQWGNGWQACWQLRDHSRTLQRKRSSNTFEGLIFWRACFLHFIRRRWGRSLWNSQYIANVVSRQHVESIHV